MLEQVLVPEAMTVYNHWTGWEWITGLLLELKVKHYISIVGFTGVIA